MDRSTGTTSRSISAGGFLTEASEGNEGDVASALCADRNSSFPSLPAVQLRLPFLLSFAGAEID
jgi:hypothetical protein